MMDNSLVHNNVSTTNNKEQLGNSSTLETQRENIAPTSTQEIFSQSQEQVPAHESSQPTQPFASQGSQKVVQQNVTQVVQQPSLQTENVYAKSPENITDQELKLLSNEKVNTVGYWFFEFVKWIKEKSPSK